MFGRALIDQLKGREDIALRVMVRDPAKFDVEADNIEVVVADMDHPETLAEPTRDVTHVFLTSPMDDHITARETAVIDACTANGTPHVIDIYGAVKHQGDHLDSMHLAAIEHLKASGLPWTLVSPNSVMETSLLPFKTQLPNGSIVGMSGDGKVGFVALEDVARVIAAVVLGEGHESKNYECTGPRAETMADVVADFAAVLGLDLDYQDLSEADYSELLLEFGIFPDQESLETNVLCHLRAWKEGRAALVTDTVEQVTGQAPMSVSQWIDSKREYFTS